MRASFGLDVTLACRAAGRLGLPGLALAGAMSCAGGGPAPKLPAPATTVPAAPRVTIEAAADDDAPRAEFRLGCEAGAPRPTVPRFELAPRDPDERWLWACRAVARLGNPTLRDSGYPDFLVHDRESGACLTLSIEDIGAFVYHAPGGRADALRAHLQSGGEPVADCSFTIGLEDIDGPRRVGVRDGQPYDEAVYDVETLPGARAYFEAYPSEASAAAFLSRVLEPDAAPVPPDAGALVEQAVTLEVAALAAMERAWLSPIGVQGYCERAMQLSTLSVSPETHARVTAVVHRFCR